MTSVSRKDGFRYGFYVFAYWLVLLAVGAALVAAGGILVTVRNGFSAVPSEALVALGGFVGFLGVVVFGAGQTGLVYKVIADGVAAGSGSRGAGNWRPAESAVDEESGAPASAGTAGPSEDTRAGATQPQPEPGVASTPRSADEPNGAGSTADAADGPAVAGRAGDADSSAGDATSPAGDPSAEDDSTDAFESGGFEPARPATESDDPDGSPVDVASESEIAEELGFGDRETSDVSDADTTIDRDDSGRDSGDDRSPPPDDPLAPDSDADPAVTEEGDRTGEGGPHPGDSDPDWTTGEDHAGSSDSPDERDGREG